MYTLNIYNSYLSIISQEQGFLWLLHGGGSQRTGHGRTPTVQREPAGAVAGARGPALGGETPVKVQSPVHWLRHECKTWGADTGLSYSKGYNTSTPPCSLHWYLIINLKKRYKTFKPSVSSGYFIALWFIIFVPLKSKCSFREYDYSLKSNKECMAGGMEMNRCPERRSLLESDLGSRSRDTEWMSQLL